MPESLLRRSQRNLIAIAILAFPMTYARSDDSPNYSVRLNVEYDTNHGLQADIYQPSKLAASCPIVIVVHGGAWMSGDKWMPATYARLFAMHGMASISINYRLAPEHKFPKQVDDLRAALAWVHANAAANQWDLDRVGLFGYSAGAHLCCLVGNLFDEDAQTVAQTTELTQGSPLLTQLPKPIAIVAGGTPADFRDLPLDNTMLRYFFGGSRREKPKAYEFGSPATLASAGDIPTLFFHGTNDIIVPIAGSEALYKRHKALGIDSKFVPIDGHGHLLTFMHETARSESLRFLKERLLNETKR